MLLLLIAILEVTERAGFESFLPTSLVGALGVLVSGGLLVDRIKNRGRKEGVSEGALNGMGERVGKVEANHKTLEGQFTEHQRSVDRVLVQNDNLLREIGKADRSVTQCRDDTERFSIDIGTKVDTMRRDVLASVENTRRDLDAKIGDLNVAVEGVKTEVRLRAEFDDQRRREA